MSKINRDIQELLVDYAGALREGCIPTFLKSLTREEGQSISSCDQFWDAAEVVRIMNDTGFADKAVTGDVAGAAEALRWAMLRGEPHVVLADALAEAVHTIARVAPLSGDPYRLASELGMPPWRVQKAQKQARRWSPTSVAEALRLVASLNADVKGVAADADYALEAAVRKVAELIEN